MNESDAIAEPRLEMPAAPAIPEDGEERSVPVKNPRRIVAGLKLNGLRCLTFAWGPVHAAEWEGTGRPEATFLLVLAGGLLAAAAKTGIDLLSWAEANRQAVHVERVHAVQRVFQRACAVRDQAVLDWRRIHTFLVVYQRGPKIRPCGQTEPHVVAKNVAEISFP